MNTAETIIDLYEKSKKTEEYKSQLDKIDEICRDIMDKITTNIATMSTSNKDMFEAMLKTDKTYMTFNKIRGIINR